MDKRLKDKLNKRIEEGTIRSLSCFEGVDFCSNDYLGLAKVTTHYIGTTFGSTGSRLISGNSPEAESCEAFLASFFQAESALVFNSGYDANIGFFSSVPQRGDTILYDELIHASIRDGIRLSSANSFSFKHNNLEHLEQLLNKVTGSIYIAVESLYSMDGDKAPLKLLSLLCKEYNAYLIIDEAHACGVLGPDGKGLIPEIGNIEPFARIITFGKAYGSHGACILCEEDLKKYLINFSRSFIYTTAMPPESYQRIEKIIVSSLLPEERIKLMDNIQFFRKHIGEHKIISDVESPIQMIRIGEVEKTKQLAEIIKSYGFFVKPIYSPTVKKGAEGIRVCLHSFNTFSEIETICKIIVSNSFF